MLSNATRKLHAIDLRSYFSLTLCFDLIGLTVAWLAVLWIRVLLNRFFPIHLSYAGAVHAAPPLSLLLLLWAVADFRQRWKSGEKPTGPAKVLQTLERALVAGALIIIATFFSREFGSEKSRSLVILFVPVSFVALLASRYLSCLAVIAIQRAWPRLERVAVIGHGEQTRRLALAIRRARNIDFAGYVVPEQVAAEIGPSDGLVLGSTAALGRLINAEGLHRLVIGSGLSEDEYSDCVEVASRMGVAISSTAVAPGGNVMVRVTGDYGLQMLELEVINFNPGSTTKRVVDVVMSSVLLIVLAPLFLIVAIAIRFTSPGPVIYRSTRVGRGGRHFTFFKFRSMISSAEALREAQNNETNGHLFKMRKDPRITPVGRIIRRTSIDELPQLVNVLRGEMSLVGPRPLPARDLDPDGMSTEFRSWAEHRSQVRPGITGLWQVSGRSDLSFEQMAHLDVTYVRTWSLISDLRILLTTPIVLLTGRGAY